MKYGRVGLPVLFALGLVAGLTDLAHAQATTRLVVPFQSGGAVDQSARLFAPHLSQALGHPVVVENRPGADAAIGTDYVARAEPNGRTLLFAISAIAAPRPGSDIKLDPQRDLTPIVQLFSTEFFLVANAGLGVDTVSGLLDFKAKRPMGLNCGAIVGATERGCGYLRRLLPNLEPIRYQGLAQAITAVMSGEIDVLFVPSSSVTQLLQSGRVRLLASASEATPLPPYQDVPLLKTYQPDAVLSSFTGIFAPARTPPEVVSKLNGELNRILSLSDIRSTLLSQGYRIVGGGPDVLATTLAREIEAYRMR